MHQRNVRLCFIKDVNLFRSVLQSKHCACMALINALTLEDKVDYVHAQVLLAAALVLHLVHFSSPDAAGFKSAFISVSAPLVVSVALFLALDPTAPWCLSAASPQLAPCKVYWLCTLRGCMVLPAFSLAWLPVTERTVGARPALALAASACAALLVLIAFVSVAGLAARLHGSLRKCAVAAASDTSTVERRRKLKQGIAMVRPLLLPGLPAHGCCGDWACLQHAAECTA